MENYVKKLIGYAWKCEALCEGYCQSLQIRFQLNISYRFRFLTADYGFPIFSVRKRKRVMYC